MREALASGAVILGRAGGAAFSNEPGVLRVRLFGPPEARIAQAARIENVDMLTARRRLPQVDRARAQYVRRLYCVSIDDPDREYWQLDLIVDRNGSIVARVPRLRLRSFSEGLVAFESEGKPAIRNWQPGHFDYRDFPGLQGFLDSTGNVAIPATFADVGPFVDGLARAALDGYCHLVTWDNGKEGSPTSGYPTSCGGAPDDAVTICKVGFIYRNGAFAIPPEFESGQDFQEGLAAVRIGGRWGFIDRDGKFAVAPRFQQTQSFSEGLAAVKIGRKWGFIDRSGALVIEPGFDSVEPFSESFSLVNSDKRQFFIDRSGRVAIQGPFREATPFVQGLASILLDEKHVAYINKSGKTVFEYSRH